ncbi:MAG: hypothetical protein JRI52_04820 [Deltaproteobacteria bacterium]|nr:hypothetical protein [Deltaproteobacteria bacterium]
MRVEIDMKSCIGIDKCGKCVRICPVNIFEAEGEEPVIVEQNQDECTLCNLCLDECTPDAVVIVKLYEE